MGRKKHKSKRKNFLSPSDMAALNAQEEKRIEAWAKKNKTSSAEARGEYFDQKRKEAVSPPAIDGTSKELIIYSKRGHRVNSKKLCDECLTIHTPLWHYSRTNKGAVHLCTQCKNEAWARSVPDSRDALDFAVTGSGFEVNRRKH